MKNSKNNYTSDYTLTEHERFVKRDRALRAEFLKRKKERAYFFYLDLAGFWIMFLLLCYVFGDRFQ